MNGTENRKTLQEMADDVRRKIRDSLSDEDRRIISDASHERTMKRLMSENDDISRIESRLERIEKRLDELALKQ